MKAVEDAMALSYQARAVRDLAEAWKVLSEVPAAIGTTNLINLQIQSLLAEETK